MTKRKAKRGRPRGSKKEILSSEEALSKWLRYEFRNILEHIWGHKAPESILKALSELDNTIDFKNQNTQRMAVAGILFGMDFVEREVFPEFIKKHIKNISLQPYADAIVKTNHFYDESGLLSFVATNQYPLFSKLFKKTHKEFKQMSSLIPSQYIRKARWKLYPSGVSKEEISLVFNKQNDGKSFSEIATDLKIPIDRVQEIVKAGKRRKMHVSTPLRVDGETVLILQASKPKVKYDKRKPGRKSAP